MPLSDLTDQNSDPLGIQNLRARQVLDKMPELILDDSGVDPSWNLFNLASKCQERSNGGFCRDSSLC